MHQHGPIRPRDHTHLAELIRTHKPFVGNSGNAAEMRPGAFLLAVADGHIWVGVRQESFPSIGVSACVWNLSTCLIPSHRSELVELANVLHAEARSTSTRLTLDGDLLWLRGPVDATVFDPEKFERQVLDFAGLAQRLQDLIRRRYSAPALLGLLSSD